MRWSVVVLAMVLVAGMAGCATGGDPRLASADVVAALSGDVDENFARAYEPRELVFPDDHGAHPEYQTEWWYYTGNLQDEAGNRYGYQFTIFRSALTAEMPERTSEWATNQVYMAHFALTDAAQGEHTSFERYSRGAAGLAGATGSPAFSVWLEDWRASQTDGGGMRLEASAETETGRVVAIDLVLNETQTPVFHGDAGLSQKGPEPGNASYYYSLVRMETTGTIRSAGKEITVSGLSWMDHEFGTSALSENAVGWDWFSIQLDQGAVLMLARIRTADDGTIDVFEGTLVTADGTQSAIRSGDYSLEVLGEWASPQTGISYPSGWRLLLPAYALDLTVEPILDDQEMDVSFVYWEGAVDVTGTVDEAEVTGSGYVELTGYGHELGDYER